MPARDPFPMQSEEAKRLEASVADSSDGGGASGGGAGAASGAARTGSTVRDV